MKTQYQYIEFFQPATNVSIWICRTCRKNNHLGYCTFYVLWKKWEFVPYEGTGYTADCCRDIAHFLEQLLNVDKGETK